MKTEGLSNELCKYRPVLSELVFSRIQCNCNIAFQAHASLAKSTPEESTQLQKSRFLWTKIIDSYVLKRSVEWTPAYNEQQPQFRI